VPNDVSALAAIDGVGVLVAEVPYCECGCRHADEHPAYANENKQYFHLSLPAQPPQKFTR
jgi:hypothetical protein